jgi:hypothetical protein
MKHSKMLSLAVMAVAAVTAFAATSASATELYSGATTQKSGTAIESSLSGTDSLTTTGGTVLDTCTGGTFSGKTTNNGGAGVNITFSVAKTGLTWSGCTKTTDTLEGGTLEIAWTSGTNGTVTGKGFKTTIVVSEEFGGTCSYTLGIGGTHLGTLLGGLSTGATFSFNAVINGDASNSFLCPADVKWVANYIVTSPKPLHATNS